MKETIKIIFKGIWSDKLFFLIFFFLVYLCVRGVIATVKDFL